MMATREASVELFYDPGELTPGAPRLYIRRSGSVWDIRDEDGGILSTHPSQNHAIDEARTRSRQRFCEILVRGSTGELEWRLDQDPEVAEIVDRLRGRHLRHAEAAD
jgi:hypothetical protein